MKYKLLYVTLDDDYDTNGSSGWRNQLIKMGIDLDKTFLIATWSGGQSALCYSYRVPKDVVPHWHGWTSEHKKFWEAAYKELKGTEHEADILTNILGIE